MRVHQRSKVRSKPAKRGDSIKPGVERAEPQDRWKTKDQPTKWATANHHEYIGLSRYRTLRALGFFNPGYPGVPLRSTPGFMLPPAPRVCWVCRRTPKLML